MHFIPLNIFPIIISAIIAHVIGMMWYSQFAFGKTWMKLMGTTPEECQPKPGMWKTYLASFVATLVMACVLAVVVSNLVIIPSVYEALKIGFFVWLGFVATTNISEYLFSVTPKPWKLFAINSGYHLVSLVAISLVLVFFL